MPAHQRFGFKYIVAVRVGNQLYFVRDYLLQELVLSSKQKKKPKTRYK